VGAVYSFALSIACAVSRNVAKMNQRIKDAAIGFTYGKAASAFFGIFQGRCTFFAIAFSVIGCYGWLILGRDLTSFAMFTTAIYGLLVAHSWKEDIAEQRQIQNQK
jgi:hypothetical protein